MADLPKPERRKPLTRRQFAELILRQEGRCGCNCGKRLKADAIIDEHVIALAFLGSNDLSNRSLWDRDCSAAKNVTDNREAKKGARVRGEKGQRARREKRGGSSIKSRNDFQRPLLPKSEDRETRSPDKASGFWKPPGHKHKWAKRKVGG